MSALTDHRPWGHYTVLADEEDHKVKRIVVQPGKRLSLQRHQHRAEHWYVVKGEARVTLDESEQHAYRWQCRGHSDPYKASDRKHRL